MNAIIIKNKIAIEKMRMAGKLLSEVMQEIGVLVKEGISTYELDQILEKKMIERGLKPECKGYAGYRHSSCISLNDVIVHGVPTKEIILKSEDFNSKMEEITIHWQDEKIALLNTIEKIVKSALQSNTQLEIPLISKNLDEDIDFAEKLVEITLKNQAKFEKMIAEQTPDWDTERIARMDLYIMTMALSEFTEFDNIPVKVTLNEYLELAKIYSTPLSSKFVNGVLDKLLNILKEKGEISKKGRGLIEN